QGGALLFRAQGSPKKHLFGTEVKEIFSLRDPNVNRMSAKLFSEISDDVLAGQIKTLTKKFGQTDLEKIILDSGIDVATGKQLHDTLTARFNYLKKWRSDHLSAKKPGPPRGPAEIIESIPEIKSATTATFRGLSHEQQAALKRYTGSGYGTINRAAVQGKPHLTLDQAIAECPNYGGWVGRGHTELTSKFAKEFEKYKTGEWAYTQLDAYTSTSYDPGGAWGKDVKLIIKNKGKHPGCFIDRNSSCPGEREYILGRKAKYQVIGWDEVPGTRKKFLFLEEVDNPDLLPEKQAAPPRVKFDEARAMWKADYEKRL
ncbi:MAG: hypothetical protein U9Q07_14795, partial [Planctomycetota bacterium]|nr:hypothetical protein [Planctomycetota bacterium]